MRVSRHFVLFDTKIVLYEKICAYNNYFHARMTFTPSYWWCIYI